MTERSVPELHIVDLHSHLVPGVDDGTSTVAESLSALAGLYQEGVRAVVTTPHLLIPHLASKEELDQELALHRRVFEELSAACARRDDLPSIALGQEIWAPDAASARRVVHRRDIGLANCRFTLGQFGFDLLCAPTGGNRA